MYEKLAGSYARHLKYDVLHVVVQQNLLPFLWRSGYLGGRTFDVLMTALPMKALQRTLDAAAKLHPESTTLGDFRAEPRLVEAEAEALQHARKVITPNTFIASLFPERAELIQWKLPQTAHRSGPRNVKPAIVFPSSTVGRRGCYELRDAIRDIDIKLLTMGPYIEGANFWEGFDAEPADDDWLTRADLVILPAHVEHRPRRLLAAAAHGIPVIATRNCGVDNVDGIETIDPGDPDVLRSAIVTALRN